MPLCSFAICDNVRLCPVQDRRRAHAMHILLIGDKGKPSRMVHTFITASHTSHIDHRYHSSLESSHRHHRPHRSHISHESHKCHENRLDLTRENQSETYRYNCYTVSQYLTWRIHARETRLVTNYND